MLILQIYDSSSLQKHLIYQNKNELNAKNNIKFHFIINTKVKWLAWIYVHRIKWKWKYFTQNKHFNTQAEETLCKTFKKYLCQTEQLLTTLHWELPEVIHSITNQKICITRTTGKQHYIFHRKLCIHQRSVFVFRLLQWYTSIDRSKQKRGSVLSDTS